MNEQINNQDQTSVINKVSRIIDYRRLWQRAGIGIAGAVLFIGGIINSNFLAIIAGLVLAIIGSAGAWQIWKKV